MKLPRIGWYNQQVYGEENYQDALIRLAGPYTKEGKRLVCDADLYLEPNNPYDRNAIRVEIEGTTVGYIGRYDAPVLRRQLKAIGILDGQRVTVEAAIGGGRIGTRYGVYLDFDLPGVPEDSPPDQVSPPASPAVADRTQPSERGAKVLAGVLLVLVALLFGASMLKSCTQEREPARRISAPAAPAVQRHTYCPDCLATGQPANVWSDATMTGVACRLSWNTPVTVLEETGGMARISGSGCQGWIRTSLIR